jgi:hypothetical protein
MRVTTGSLSTLVAVLVLFLTKFFLIRCRFRLTGFREALLSFRRPTADEAVEALTFVLRAPSMFFDVDEQNVPFRRAAGE